MSKLFDRDIRFTENDFGVSVKISLFCGRSLEFNVSDVAHDKLESLSQTVQRQVNEVVARERHAAVEDYKARINSLLQPRPFVIAQQMELSSPEYLLRHVEQDIAVNVNKGKESMYGETTWKIGDTVISGENFNHALSAHLVRKHGHKQ